MTVIGNGGGSTDNLDAFERLRVSTPQSLHDWKSIHDRGAEFWNESTTGGGTITYNAAKSQVDLAVGTTSGDEAIRQTTRYYPYFPGKSQLVILTGVPGEGKANVRKRGGLFDDLNGLFFEFDGLDVNVVRRTDTSGSAVDNKIAQADWNIDTLDGNGKSGILLDASKTNIFMIDFQWLGVGAVRFGVDVDGVAVYCHQINNANTLDVAYMSTGSLPVRYEITNTGTAASGSTMSEICSSVASEGGFQLFGFDGSVGNGTTLRNVTTREPVFAIRLTNAINGKRNRRTIVFNGAQFFSNDKGGYFELAHVKGHSSVTATWTDFDTGSSGVEYSTDISAVTGGNQHVFLDAHVAAGKNDKASGTSVAANLIGRHHYVSQNIDSTDSELFVVFATQLIIGTAQTSSSIQWIEME